MIDEDGFIVARSQRRINRRSAAIREAKPIQFMTADELMSLPVGDEFVFDIEVYPNFFFAAFKHLKSQRYYAFEQSPSVGLEHALLSHVLWRCCMIGFYSNNYDMPILSLVAHGGLSNAEIKEANDDIIVEGMKPYEFYEKKKIKRKDYNHIDLIEVAPLEGPLKLYHARLHGERLQDLPFDPDDELTAEEAQIVRLYCCNDLDATEMLFKEMTADIELRKAMTQKYGIDLRSKSDAQIAEAVINIELAKTTGRAPQRPYIADGFTFKYAIPAWIQYESKALNSMLDDLRHAIFSIGPNGKPVLPKALEGRIVNVGGVPYKMGVGGLHSMETSIAHKATPKRILRDRDVASFYPRIILTQGLAPSHLGNDFLFVYNQIVEQRLQAKRDKNKSVADSLKITINGSFGKFGNKYSTLYAPQLLLQVTITGQLALLLLIEMYVRAGIEVISANTDGVITAFDPSNYPKADAVVKEWERITGYETEETEYSAVYSRDVNNYIAVKTDGSVKVKGVFSERGSARDSVLSKSPETLICNDAILAYLKDGTPIELTIMQCRDFRRFVSVARITGDAGEHNGVYLGKVVRWYYRKGETGCINRISSGNKVPMSDGGTPVMDLPASFPDDINYRWYIDETKKMMKSCAIIPTPKTGVLF